MKKFGMSLVVLASVLVLGACGGAKDKKSEAAGDSKDAWATIEKNKKVIVGLDDTFVPMGFKDEAGEITGFDVDLANAVFADYDIEVEFQSIDWSMKETELDNGTIDLIWNGYSVNPAREKKVLFTDSYMKNQQVLVAAKSDDIKSFKDMKDKKLGAQEGSSGYESFSNQPEVLKDLVADQDAVLYASFSEAFIDLESKRIDGLLIDKVYANYYLTQNGKIADYEIIDGEYKDEAFAVGARKSDKTLVDKINEEFKKLQENGKFAEISDKWFGEDVTPK
ncbi:amino acid ABC transporter substrate-binding protein [Enterococcus sp. JM4C]|uniref:amino acid ABC transporter substrate-binding protein n=1 Tax=Candidatus Enterococcus huntleyi TaxID=1857217 RepID=UPI00137B8143|nr:amino acid ABC transporter substrate-binding protein [Enterococcus sp. JM4C]KAF1295622.1 amino acid ABC transporter substrate-binding protein [Enterococcus sp. JM4C]